MTEIVSVEMGVKSYLHSKRGSDLPLDPQTAVSAAE